MEKLTLPISSIVKIKMDNFIRKIENLQEVDGYNKYCELALEEYEFMEKDENSIAKWIKEHSVVYSHFEEIFSSGDFFDSVSQFKHSPLELLDETIYGFSINVPRKYFEKQLRFVMLYEELTSNNDLSDTGTNNSDILF
ncbi:hypothetical protein G5B10_07900 [Fluviicola sp. SGL-29]|nr:hypothetical protein [Fluviicola sp. SGL-29]